MTKYGVAHIRSYKHLVIYNWSVLIDSHTFGRSSQVSARSKAAALGAVGLALCLQEQDLVHPSTDPICFY